MREPMDVLGWSAQPFHLVTLAFILGGDSIGSMCGLEVSH